MFQNTCLRPLPAPLSMSKFAWIGKVSIRHEDLQGRCFWNQGFRAAENGICLIDWLVSLLIFTYLFFSMLLGKDFKWEGLVIHFSHFKAHLHCWTIFCFYVCVFLDVCIYLFPLSSWPTTILHSCVWYVSLDLYFLVKHVIFCLLIYFPVTQITAQGCTVGLILLLHFALSAVLLRSPVLLVLFPVHCFPPLQRPWCAPASLQLGFAVMHAGVDPVPCHHNQH